MMKTKHILVFEEPQMTVQLDFIKKMVDVHFVAWDFIVLVSKQVQSHAMGTNFRAWELVLAQIVLI